MTGSARTRDGKTGGPIALPPTYPMPDIPVSMNVC
ncbi:MAG: hypothetical protein JWO38_7463 [Gemmataceae bacterium]|nr:hypothetical protein [Gemmataceae bacterium]